MIKETNLITGEFFRESTGFPLHTGTSLSLFLSMPARAMLIRNVNRNLEENIFLGCQLIKTHAVVALYKTLMKF